MSVRIITGDCRDVLPILSAQSVHCCVTSPPYFGLRDYGIANQIGLEPTPDAYIAELVSVFRQVHRILRDDGTLWLNLGDSYAGLNNGYSGDSRPSNANGSLAAGNRGARACGQVRKMGPGLKPKDLIGIPWRTALALQADGWYLRSDIIWHKPNPMPESVTDRPTSAHEHVFLLAKRERYFYDADAIAEDATSNHTSGNGFVREHRLSIDGRGSEQEWTDIGGKRNARNVWTIPTEPYAEAHFATFPPALAERCIRAGCPPAGTVLDPFGGAGTTALAADRLQRNGIAIELNPAYATLAGNRLHDDAPLFAQINRETA